MELSSFGLRREGRPIGCPPKGKYHVSVTGGKVHGDIIYLDATFVRGTLAGVTTTLPIPYTASEEPFKSIRWLIDGECKSSRPILMHARRACLDGEQVLEPVRFSKALAQC